MRTVETSRTRYGYMMVMLARVDLLSRYWKGRSSQKGEQTKRMVEFLDAYVKPGEHAANCVKVQLWRHTLMHTAEARELTDPVTNDTYSWQLYFGPHPGIRHYDLWAHPAHGKMVQSLVMTEFVRDLQRGRDAYLADLAQRGSLQAIYQKEHRRIQSQETNFQHC